jgi:hypothetical protein
MSTRIIEGTPVSVQLWGDDGEPEHDPIVSKYVRIRGVKRSAVLAASGPLTDEEKFLNGASEDWLTLVAVADSKEKLENMPELAAAPHDDAALTSAFSLRVKLALDVGNRKETRDGMITIATGTRVPGDPHLYVNAITVIPTRG